MSYRVRTDTLLFVDLTDEEAKQLQTDMEALILKGERGPINSTAFKMWSAVCRYSEDQELLMYSTVYPQRALLSLLRRKEEKG